MGSISGFYHEINRVFMAGEDWELGESLDALNDLLYGGFGAASGDGPVCVAWADMAQSRAALGREATRAWLLAKLAAPERFNAAAIRAQLEALEQGAGETYFEIVLSVFAGHPRFRIVPE